MINQNRDVGSGIVHSVTAPIKRVMDCRPRIALIVDHPRRDLAGLVLTAFELCQKGAVCHLVPAAYRGREIWALAPDLVVLFNARNSMQEWTSQLLEAGIEFGLLDAEGGVWPSPAKYSEMLWANVSLLKRASFNCAWGPALANHVVSEGFFSSEQVVVTGCPRFDFYHPRWRNVLQESKANGKSEKPKILVNTNTSEINQLYISVEKNMAFFRNVYGWSEERVREHFDAQQRGLELTLDLIRDLARDYPDFQVVVRPHPFENPDVYRRRLGDLEGVEINASGPVQPQIFNAAAVIQRSCTTGFESGFAGVPTLSPQWIPIGFVLAEAESVSVQCESYSAMRQHLDAILGSRYQTPQDIRGALNAIIKDWFYRIDGLSYKRVSDTILERQRGGQKVDEASCRRNLYGLNNQRESGPKRIARRLRYEFRLTPDWSFRRMRQAPALEWRQTDHYFGVAEVSKLTERISRTRASAGSTDRTLEVGLARGRGDYLENTFGHSVTLS